MKQFFSKKIIITVAAVLVLAGLIITYLIASHKILYHFETVDSGKMYRSGTLSPLGLSWAHQIAGFKTIINLRSVAENKLPWHKQEQEFCQQNGIKMVDIPMNSDEPPTLQQVKLFLEVVKKPENLPIIVHCHQGVTRTAMMVAVYEIEVEGKDNEQVLKYMETFGHNFNKPEKEEIVDFILNYKRQKPESE